MSEKDLNAFISDTYSDQKQQHLNFCDSVSLSSLRTLQKVLLRILGDYWLNKWLLHRQTLEWLQSSPRDKENEEKEAEKGERDKMVEKAPVEQLKNEIDKLVKGRVFFWIIDTINYIIDMVVVVVVMVVVVVVVVL